MMTRRAGVALALVLATTAAGGVAGVASALPTGMSNPVCTTDCTEDGEGYGAGEARVRGWWRNADGESRLRSQGQGFGAGNGSSGNGLGSGGYGQGGNGLGAEEHEDGTGPGVASGGQGNGGPTGEHSDIPPAVEGAEITDEVAAELLYLAEEEKLAGDVYDLAATLYGVRIFDNIGRSEDNHLAEVRVLLDRYDLDDPTADAAAGEFTNPELQKLYDTLAAQVKQGWDQAVAAGILIEETDIADLQVLLEKSGLPADVQAIAESLLAGSQRHLAAFQRQAA
jgi:hypothetical protein